MLPPSALSKSKLVLYLIELGLENSAEGDAEEEVSTALKTAVSGSSF